MAIYEGSPKRMAMAWAAMIVSMFTGYAYVKSMNRAKKKEYITMQAQADDGDMRQLPKHVISTSTNSRQSSPIQQLYTSLKRQWEKKVNGG
ncbi:Uncharacterized protein MSYG_3040 [Malassezia sympodialis ATCC 42132]|uniref:Uncharacterized protein n=1 Tax=Malassezia sympodialis (strain ATCC 42132) TaxID=1230383 RepID=A0A1M8A8C3_MALS4|nr:Uncharacterized protein MSYG_3040 [Malassezia sympodialis ATCC 42132]